MKKYFYSVILLVILSLNLYAQSPLGSRGIEWNEQDGYAIVNGKNYHYWLYSMEYFCDYHNWDRRIIGKSSDDRLGLLHTALLQWVEKQGWTVDYDNVLFRAPNNDLALSVKNLMLSRSKNFGILDINSKYMDVSVTIETYSTREAALYINYWNFMKENYYETWIYHLIKF